MEELLKELGYTEEQIKAIIDGMKNKKIFTTAEENADIRLQKLNDDFTAKDGELTKANELIQKLQKDNKGNGDLQKKIEDYETEITQMKKEQEQDKIDNAIKIALLSNKAKADDIDYLMFKIKNSENKIELDDKGNLKNFDVEDIKKTYKNNFESKAEEFVDVKKLGSDGKRAGNGEKEEPETLLDALKEKYAPKDET